MPSQSKTGVYALCQLSFFFFNDTATTEIYTLSLHDALPILPRARRRRAGPLHRRGGRGAATRSEEHTSELQSHLNLVCRLLLEKKKIYFGEDRSRQIVHTTSGASTCPHTA